MTHLQPTDANRAQLAPLARHILLREHLRGHLRRQGPLIRGGNWCQKCCHIFLQLTCTVSHRKEGAVVKSPSKATVITQEIDSEIEKSLQPHRQPIPQVFRAKIPAVWQVWWWKCFPRCLSEHVMCLRHAFYNNFHCQTLFLYVLWSHNSNWGSHGNPAFASMFLPIHSNHRTIIIHTSW